MLKNVGTAFSLLGAVIGAGMMTGAEIRQYFGSGNSVFLNIFISVSVIAVMFGIFIWFCNANSISCIADLGKILFGRYSLIFRLFISLNSIICCGAMLAGTSELLNKIFNINTLLCSVVIALLGSLIAYKGIECIKNINLLVIPIIVLFIFFLLLVSDIKLIDNKPQNLFSATVFSVYNVALALPLCCALRIPKDNLKYPLIIFSTISFGIISIISIIIGNFSSNSSLPIFDFIMLLSPIAAIIYSLILIFASVSTYISSMIAFNKNKTYLFFGTALAIILSAFELKNIVIFIYPLSGLLCVVCLIAIIFKYKKGLKQ